MLFKPAQFRDAHRQFQAQCLKFKFTSYIKHFCLHSPSRMCIYLWNEYPTGRKFPLELIFFGLFLAFVI